MPTYNEEKLRLLHQLKAETLNQLSAVQAEDPEGFLASTERCNPIIESLDQLQGMAETDEVKVESRGILQEISVIRDEISLLVQPLYVKIKQKAVAEKNVNIVKRHYYGSQAVPSIFLDKKI